MYPEDLYHVTLTEEKVIVSQSNLPPEEIRWNDITEIRLSNNDAGPFTIDIWMVLIGSDKRLFIPHGSGGYDNVYDRVSQWNGFDFEAVIASMGSTGNEEFILWKKG